MPMTCDQFQNLLPDALGDEMSTADQAAFDAHLRACDACRREHAELARTLTDLRGVARTPAVQAHREGDRLVIDLVAGASAPHGAREAGPWRSALRYAAVILLAFAAGYTTSRGGLRTVPSKAGDSGHSIAQTDAPVTPSTARPMVATFESALIEAHERNPGATDLAKCMRALLGTTR